MVCSNCVRRLTDCCELIFQIEQSEQILLEAMSNRLFLGLNYEDSRNSDQQLSKSNSIIDTIHSVVVNAFESTSAGCESAAAKSFHDKATDDTEEVVTEVEAKDHLSEKRSTKSTFNCLICLKKFSTVSKLDIHLSSNHLVRNDLNIYKPHRCDECPKSYTTKANLVLHRAVHSGKKQSITDIFSNNKTVFHS